VPLKKILLASLSLAFATAGYGQSVASVQFDPPTFSPGQSTTGIVYLSAPAPAGLTVNLSSSRADFVVPSSISVPAGGSSATFALTTATNMISASSVITASGGGSSRKATATSIFSGGGLFISFMRASLTSTDAQANGHSGEPFKVDDGDSRKISGDGRFIVFTSQATNLVTNDKNRKSDVFLRDRQLGTTVRVSQLSSGIESNGNSYEPSLSADGNFVAFVSEGSNLVSGDANGKPDVFLWNRATGAITLASRNGNALGNDASYQPSISKDGKFVAYMTYASNLSGSDMNGWADIYVYDSSKGTSKRASIGSNPWAVDEPNGDCGSPSISANGRYVAYESFADNLVPNDDNVSEDVFVRDMNLANGNTLVSLGVDGLQLDGFSFSPSISADGKVVAYSTYAPIIDPNDSFDYSAKVLVRTLNQPASEVIADNYYADAIEPSISADGRFVAFVNYNYNTNVFLNPGLYDRDYKTQFPTPADNSWDLSLSGDGRYLAFSSSTRSAVAGDTNGKDDVFIADANAQRVVGIQGPGLNGNADNIVAGDTIALKLNLLQPAKTDLILPLSTFGPGVTAPATVTVPAGSLSASFKVVTSAEGIGQSPAVLIACNSRVAGIGIWVTNGALTVPFKIKAGTSATAKIRLAAPATSAITFTIYGASGVTLPVSVKIPAGGNTKSFTVKVPEDMPVGNYWIQAVGDSGYYFGAQFIVVK